MSLFPTQDLREQAQKKREEAAILRQVACGLSLARDRELFERQARSLEMQACQIEAERRYG